MKRTFSAFLGLSIGTGILACLGCAPLHLAHEKPVGGLAEGTIPVPTLGGTQFWSDVYFLHQWRIQQHCSSGECRLLDPQAWRHASGTFEQCRARLEEIRQERDLPPMVGKAVVLMHGLAAPRWSMHLLGEHLRNNGGYHIFNVEYASTRRSIDEHAESLASVLASLEGIDVVHLVGHSMGNVVIRRYLAEPGDGSGAWRPDPRIRRIVMIAPPNHGAIAARRLANFGLFKKVFGEAGQQLGAEWNDLETRLAVPGVEFGIIGGGVGYRGGISPLLPGDDDGRITLDTTRLVGAEDFVRVSAVHELIANDPRVFRYTLRFLEEGYFISPEQRQPIVD